MWTKFTRFVLLGVLILMAFPIYADTVEIANVSAHYAHPLTGVVEDSGNDPAIGQGMTESVLDPQALIETDSSGQVFATVRIHMQDQIGSYHFAVQNQGDSDFYQVNAKEMRRDNESVDFRLPLPSKDSIIRFEFLIKAMGRNVVFYGAILDRVEGNTDFIVSVNPNQAGSGVAENTSVTEELPITQESSNTTPVKIGDKLEKKEKTNESGASDLKGPSLSGEVGLLLKGDPRLSGDFKETPKEDDNAPYGILTQLMLYSFFIVFAVIAVLVFIAALAAACYVRHLRYQNDRKEAILYGLEKMPSE